MKAISRKIIISLLVIILFAAISGVACAADIIEKYPGTDIVKRIIKEGTGYIYEYSNEDLWGDGYNRWGKLILARELAGYKTFAWGATQVTVTEYAGDYTPVSGSDTWSDVVIGERRVSYLYDHHDEFINLDTQTNGWVMREKTIYAVNGITILESFAYNTSGVMARHSLFDANGALAEDYFYNDTGRLIRNDVVATDRYYTYSYIQGFDNPRYKYEYARSTSTLLTTYELISDVFYIKKEADGHIYTYTKVNGTWLTNTQFDPDGTASFYYYDSGLVRQGVTKYFPNGNVEKLDGQWVLTEKIENETTFFKGGSLPWLNYGHDLGSRDPYSGFSVNSHKATLIQKLSNFAGGTVRLFLFTDLRDVVDFSGPTLRFYDEAKLYRDMDALLESAAITGTKLIPALFDYWLAYGSATGDTGHPELFKDTAKRNELMVLMASFISHYQNRPEILMWDLINEPYYGTSANPWGRGTQDGHGNYILSIVTVEEMRSFINALLSTVRANDPNKDITIGFANKEIMNQYWSSFIDGGMDDIDIIQIHYWAKYYGYNFDELDFSSSDPIFRGLPVFIGEIDPQYYSGTDPDFKARLDAIFGNGYIGGLFWQGDGATEPISPADLQRIQEWYRGTDYKWDYAGNKITKTLVEGTIYEYDLDPAWRLKRELKPGVTDTVWAYEGTTSVVRTKIITDLTSGLVTTYTYYDSGRMHTKQASNDGAIYEYSDEDWNGRTYGKLLKMTFAVGIYFTYGEYYAATDQPRYVRQYDSTGAFVDEVEYDSTGRVLSQTNTEMKIVWYPSGGIESKTLFVPDESGNIYYHYPMSSIYPDIIKRQTPDSDGAIAYKLIYSGNVLINKKCYADSDMTILKLTYTYYGGVLPFQKILEQPDADGFVYYEYYPENFNNQGYGRLAIATRRVADSDGIIGYGYSYSDTAPTRIVRKVGFYNYTYSQPTRVKFVYTYYDNVENLLESRAEYDPFTEELISYYHYLDENYSGRGYGRVDRQINITIDVDGAIAYIYQYLGETEIVEVKYLFSDTGFSNLVCMYIRNPDGTYSKMLPDGEIITFYDSGRMHTKTLVNGTVYEYSDEDWNGRTYGKLIKETLSGGAYKTFEEYFAGTDQARFVKEYNPGGVLEVAYEYYQGGVLKKKEQSNGYIFEYYQTGNLQWVVYPKTVTYEYGNENFNGTGCGRLIREIKPDGTMYLYTNYYAGSAVFGTKEEFDRYGSLVETTEYYSNGNIKSRIRADGAVYEYYQSGQLERNLTPDGFEYMFDVTGRMVSEKYPDGAYYEDIVNLAESKILRNIYADDSKTVLLKIEVFTYAADPGDYSSWTYVETINPSGYATSQDEWGRLYEETVPGIFSLIYNYYDLTSIVSQKTYTNLSTGSIITYEYDPLARLIREVINDQIEVLFLYYSSTGNVCSVVGRDISNPSQISFIYQYRENGTLSYKKSFDGNVTESRYDEQGRIKYLKIEGVSETVFTYDLITGKLTKKAVNNVSPGGFTVTSTIITEYHQNGQIAKVTNLDGIVYEYDTFGRLIKEYPSTSMTIYYEYNSDADVNYALKKVIDDSLLETTFYSYNSDGILMSTYSLIVGEDGEILPGGVVRLIKNTYYDGSFDSYTYFGATTVVQTHIYQDRDGKATIETYSSLGKLLQVVNWNDLITTYIYESPDSSGRLVRKSNSDGTYEEYTYWTDTDSLKTKTMLDKWGSRTIEEYNEAGLLTKTTYIYGWYNYSRVTTYEYDGSGRLLRKNYSYGSREEYEYWSDTEVLKIKREIDSYGKISTTEYNQLGNITRYASSYGYVTAYQYDASNRLERVNYGSSSYLVHEYHGSTDKLTKTTYFYSGAISYTIEYGYYGDYEKLKSETYRFTDGSYYRCEYDPVSGKIIKTSTAEGYDTYYEYDSLDRISRIDYAFGYTEAYTYYGNSENIMRAIYVDELGHMTTYEYLEDGRISRTTDWDGLVMTYSYDSLKRLAREDSSDGSYGIFTYDGDSTRTLTFRYTYSDGTFYASEYTYYPDTFQTRTARYTDRSGRSTLYEYNPGWKMGRITYPDGKVAIYTYGLDGRVARIDYSTGAYTTYEYYSNGVTKKILNHYEDGTQSYDEYTYYESSYWIMKSQKHTDRDGGVTLYEYNASYQLTTVTRPDGVVETYSYDSHWRKSRIECSDGARTEYTYAGDSWWNLTRIDYYSNTGGHSYEAFTYYNDVFGNAGLETHSFYYEDGTYTKLFYDAFGTILKEHLRDGRTAYYSSYDSLSRVTRKDFSDGTFTIIHYDADTNNISEVLSYYASGNIESKTLTTADQYGSVYYHYMNENFNDTGTGRVDKQVITSADSDGAIAYEYDYADNTNTIAVKRGYSDTNFTTLVATYTRNADGTYSKTQPGLISEASTQLFVNSPDLDAQKAVEDQITAERQALASQNISQDGNMVSGTNSLNTNKLQ